MADSADNSTEYEQIPSHIIVQKQLQDLIAIQKARVARLEQDVIFFLCLDFSLIRYTLRCLVATCTDIYRP